MTHRRFTFKTLPPEYANLKNWRRVDVSDLPETDQDRFTHLKIGIETYVRTGKLKAASNECGYSEDFIIKQMNRCVTVASDGQLFGWAGLLKGVRVKAYDRKSPLPTGPMGSGKGFAGCFARFLLEHDDLRRRLDALILKKKQKGEIHEVHISIKKLTATFRDLCREYGVHENEYPLNVMSHARRSIGRYVTWLVQQQPAKGTKARYGKAASRYLSVGTGETSTPQALAPYDLSGLDAHEC